jgi:DNA-damage-inducible protein J
MSKTSTVRARIEPSLKKEVEDLFHKLGLSTTEAINIFYCQVKMRQGLPFSVALPNEKTKRVFEDTDEDQNVIHCSDVDELFKKLEI